MKRRKSLGNPIEQWVISAVFTLYIKPMKVPRLESSVCIDFISGGNPQATDLFFLSHVSSGLHLRFELKIMYH